MAGLVTTTSRNGAGSGYADGNPTFRRYVTSATIQKPLGCTIIVMEVIGGGGSGAGGTNSASGQGGGGGGGGALARGSYNADSLPSSLVITVGAAAAGAPSGDAGAAGNFSAVTGTSFILKAWGGGGGGGSTDD